MLQTPPVQSIACKPILFRKSQNNSLEYMNIIFSNRLQNLIVFFEVISHEFYQFFFCPLRGPYVLSFFTCGAYLDTNAFQRVSSTRPPRPFLCTICGFVHRPTFRKPFVSRNTVRPVSMRPLIESVMPFSKTFVATTMMSLQSARNF